MNTAIQSDTIIYMGNPMVACLIPINNTLQYDNYKTLMKLLFKNINNKGRGKNDVKELRVVGFGSKSNNIELSGGRSITTSVAHWITALIPTEINYNKEYQLYYLTDNGYFCGFDDNIIVKVMSITSENGNAQLKIMWDNKFQPSAIKL